MPKIIVTAEVEDGVKWEEAFRSHLDLFREMSMVATHFSVTAENEVAICNEVTDVEKFLSMSASPAVAEAQAGDGVKPGTVKVFVLDKEIAY